MRPEDRATARRKLDNKLITLEKSEAIMPPSRGWIKAIREALGMTTAQLGRRLGVSQPRATVIEKAEVEGSITLNTLEKAAQAMDCRLVYAIVPRTSLEDMIEKRARKQAEKLLKTTSHTMLLEDQGVEAEDELELLQSLARKLMEKGGSSLWDDE